MKEYLIGVGGVGGFYGGLLAESGADITLVSRGESFRAIKEDGLVLSLTENISFIHPKIIEHISDITKPDLLILAVKSYHLEEVSQELQRVTGPETTVITLQNGLDNDLVVSERIEEKLWKKFLFVVSFSSATVAGMCPIGEALKSPSALRVFKDVLAEAIAVGEKEGVMFEPDIFETTLAGALSFDTETKSSMLVDLEHGSQTEVEALHGTLIRLAEKHGLDVPVTREIYRNIVE